VGELSEALVSGPAADALRDGRQRFNALFAVARQAHPVLDAGFFAAQLARRLPPAVEAADALLPGSALPVAEALFEALLELSAAGRLGESAAGLDEVFDVVLPACAGHLTRVPRTVAAAICNAYLQVAAVPGARTAQWCSLLATAAPQAPSIEALLDAGLVAAWRAGMAHARTAALDALRRLEPHVAGAALGMAGLTTEDLDALVASRWSGPAPAPPVGVAAPAAEPAGGGRERLAVVGRVGAFRGFGGGFLVPPRVLGVEDGVFAVEGGTGVWWLHADRFGATLRRGAPEAAGGGSGALRIGPDGAVTVEGVAELTLAVPALAGATSAVSSADTLAATTAGSHSVVLVALVPA
jgi:hypothetical protein